MKIVIDWNEYITWCNIIPKKILEFGLKTDYIYGIPRGGLIPGTIISYQLDIPCLYTESDLLTAIHSDKKTVVIVDDILDSGTTVENLWKKISIKGNESSRVQFFFVLTKGKVTPEIPYDYVRQCPNIWIEFPYETGAISDTISNVKSPE